MKNIAIHIYISGRVQGVNYRYSTLHQAKKLGITGWVRNLYDGRVEALLEGDEKSVEEMLSWCHQGPPMAYVINVEIFKKKFTGEYNDFKVVN